MQNKMKKYQLLIDDEKFWRDVKKKCASCGITAREAITELLRFWVNGEFDDIIDLDKD